MYSLKWANYIIIIFSEAYGQVKNHMSIAISASNNVIWAHFKYFLFFFLEKKTFFNGWITVGVILDFSFINERQTYYIRIFINIKFKKKSISGQFYYCSLEKSNVFESRRNMSQNSVHSLSTLLFFFFFY